MTVYLSSLERMSDFFSHASPPSLRYLTADSLSPVSAPSPPIPSCPFTPQGNYYGTPKPPAEPNLVQPDLVDQVLFDEDYGGEVPRKRTTSVSKMDRKDSVVPEEEDDDERPPLVNGLPGQ